VSQILSVEAVIFILTFLGMEFMAWFMHKYVMHGFLWSWHEDHHVPHTSFFEKNDRFFVFFAIPSSLSIFLGLYLAILPLAAFGFGIAAYGIAYFLVHDVFIHERFRFLKFIRHPYMLALKRAHQIHHKKHGKYDTESFGMLVVDRKFFA
jgi:beta-carotene 3-hydroxylase